MEAVLACCESLWGERVIAYRAAHALDDEPAIVHRLIDSERSGVMFTVDPSAAGTNQAVIEDFVLGRRDLDVLRAGVEAGRVAFANTLKYVRTTTSANFGNMLSMAVASLYLSFLPLVASQILLNNFLSDIPQTFIATDHVDPEATTHPGRGSVRDVRDFMFGVWSRKFVL